MPACPNCGDAVPEALSVVKMTTCESCGSSLFVRDAALVLAGQAGVMHDAPLLFGVGDRIKLDLETVTLHGHARFSYGRGFWDEFWGLTEAGASVWVSVDEGDIVLQYPIPPGDAPSLTGPLQIGRTVTWAGEEYRVSEVDVATCVGLRGQFDHVLEIGETYRFANLTGPDASLLSGEFWEGGSSWYQGIWCDPFEIELGPTA